MKEKICSVCKIKKTLDNFYPRKNRKTDSSCNKCCTEKKRRYRLRNLEHCKEISRKWRKKRTLKIKEENRTQYLKNRESRLEYQKKYNKKNKNKIRIYYRTYDKIRKDKIQRKIRNAISRRILHELKGKKVKKTCEYIGCSIETLMEHIQKQFKEGMTWENHGLYTWHIDHIEALSKFDLTQESERYKAFNYNNLQPLWALENLKKGKK